MKGKIAIPLFVLILLALILNLSCEKRDFKLMAKVKTTTVKQTFANTANVEGEIVDIGKGITDYGHCWSLAQNPTINSPKTSLGTISKTGSYTSDLTNLEPRKLYHVRAYVKNGDEVAYGDDKSFTTLGLVAITSTAATGISASSATIGGNISDDGGSAITERGVYWRASASPDTTGTKISTGSGKGVFSSSLSGLTSNTLYSFKTYAINSLGTTYGTKLSFATVLDPPTNTSAVAGNTQATISFTAPATNGGAAITGYKVTSSPGNLTGTGSASPITVTGLTNGISYTFTVIAQNTNGNSSPGSPSNAVIPSTPSSVPGPPAIGTATKGNAQATVTFTAPASNGGSAITGYTVISNPGGFSGTNASSPITVSGLTNGTTYTFTVIATNANGNSSPSSASNPIIPSTVPCAPTIETAVPGNTQATVTFTAPLNNGGSAITSYTVTSSQGNITSSASSSPITVTGLTNGIAYTFRVVATNINGNSVSSSASNSVIPFSSTTPPGAPTIGTAIKGNAQATVTFTAPSNNGGSPITGYTVTSSPGGISRTSPSIPITVTGLTNGIAYTFTVIATNAIGNSSPSSASNPVIPSTFPSAPTIGTAVAGNAQATVTFTPPVSNGGSAITSYTVTSNPGSITNSASSSPITVAGLTNGIAYTFRVVATNINGNSSSSSASNSVTPLPDPPAAVTIAAIAVGSTSATLIGSINPNNANTVITFKCGPTPLSLQSSSFTATPSPLNGTNPTSVSVNLNDLSPGVTYRYMVVAESLGGITYGETLTFRTPETVYDYDLNFYDAIIIGTQVWMKENLKTTHYNNGLAIPPITVNTDWSSANTHAFSWYNNNEASYKSPYGALYNWYAVNNGNICPTGWHVPSDPEWTTLTDYIINNYYLYIGIGSNIAKSLADVSGWSSSSTAGAPGNDQSKNNSSGFTAVPIGDRSPYDGTFAELHLDATWWSSSSFNTNNAIYRVVSYNSGVLGQGNFSKKSGFAIRCLKD